jgi:hypothetical protein
LPLIVLRQRHAVAKWLRYYASSRKVAGLGPDEVIEFSIYLTFLAALYPEVYSVSNRNEQQNYENKFSEEHSAAGVRVWKPRRQVQAHCLDNVGSLRSHNTIGLYGLLWEYVRFEVFTAVTMKNGVF